MKTPILFILAVTAAFLVTVNSCTKTVTETKEVDSTIRDTVRDTTRDTAGGTSLRFISMFPYSASNSMDFTADSGGGNFAFVVNGVTSPYYRQVSPSIPLTYYLYLNQSNYLGSIQLPTLGAGSFTVAVFDTSDGIVQFAIGNDSAKSMSAPPGYCYLRFVNGVNDYPSPFPQFYLDLDGTDTSVFLTNGITRFDRPYGWKEISPYVLIPSGTHAVNLRDSPLGSVLYPISNITFQSGSYYTAHVTGTQAAGNIVFAIDGE